VEIAVSDSGPGVPASSATDLRVVPPRGRWRPAGLGLAIAKAFVEAHAAELESDRHAEAGSLCADSARGISFAAELPGDDESLLTRVLVVDDDPALLRALRIGLEARGFDVVVAHTAQKGSPAQLSDAHLVVLDLGLPDIDGVDVCRRLRQWTDVPVIVLSALDSEDRKVLALDSGADDYVTSRSDAGTRGSPEGGIAALGGRDPSAAPATLTVGPIHIDVGARLVKVAGTAIELTHGSSTCSHTWPATQARYVPTGRFSVKSGDPATGTRRTTCGSTRAACATSS